MKKTLLFSFIACTFSLAAQQQVTFTNQSSLLATTSGFTINDCAVDMNGDFLDDVVRVSSSKLFIDYQQADGTFIPASFDINFFNQPSWSICAGDLDKNGFNDLLFGDGDAVSFVKANDDGTAYTETPLPSYIFSQRSTMADIDNDGHLDAFVCHDVDQSHPYRNDGSGNMLLDQSLIVTHDRPGNYAAIWTDYDNDGDIDLYITKCKGGSFPGDIDRTNLLYQNNDDGTFTEVGETAGVGDNAQSWSTVVEDFDNDGDMDFFIVNHDMKNRFYLNNGDGTFTDIIDQTGIDPNDLGAWENASGDFNNDGWVDIFSELTNEFYLNNGDLTFTGQSSPIKSGGIGDFNDDGFLDVIRGSGLYINEGNDNNWIKINTVGFQSNMNGIGARVEIYGTWGKQIREVRSGQSFSPMSSMQIHFGIGQADAIDKVIVKWPSGIITTVDNPEINTSLTILEAGCLLPPSEIIAESETSICPGTTVDLIAPGGFEYNWSNGATTQTIAVGDAGNYDVILTDTAGCISVSNTITVDIINDAPPAITTNDDLLTFCEGGSIELFVLDGNNPVWSNGDTGQSTILTETTVITVSVDAICSTDPLTSEETTVTELASPEPVVMDVTVPQGQSIEITATGENLEWYDELMGGTLLGLGNTFMTPSLDLSTTYYVESHNLYPGEILDGGKPDNTGGGGLPSTGAYSYFNAWEAFTLVSVRVYVPNNAPNGLRTIQLVDANDAVLDEISISLTQGEHVIDLNFEVPIGNDYSLRCLQNNLFRNNSGIDYPYPIGDMGEITTSFYGDGFYYYFYDWKVQKKSFDCVSDRVPVNVEVTDVSEEFAQAGFSIFPNPVSSNLFVKMDTAAERITLLDAQGRLVSEKTTAGFTTDQIEVADLSAGIYTIQIMSDGQLFHQRFVKE